jgi:hypothetical protein
LFFLLFQSGFRLVYCFLESLPNLVVFEVAYPVENALFRRFLELILTEYLILRLQFHQFTSITCIKLQHLDHLILEFRHQMLIHFLQLTGFCLIAVDQLHVLLTEKFLHVVESLGCDILTPVHDKAEEFEEGS